MELWGVASVFVLAVFGMVLLFMLMVAIWVVYRYDITLSVKNRETGEERPAHGAPQKIKKGK